MRIWLLLLLLFLAPSCARAETFDNWAVAVVAGDSKALGGRPTQAFDNARRDLVWALQSAGVRPGHLLQFSSTARLRGEPDVLNADRSTVADAWMWLTKRATAGCLFYITSHGNPDGVVVGDQILPPRDLDLLLDLSCGTRPTIVVVSACFSGVFIPALAASNRFVMTAARRDRSSFGCSEDAIYPYFDDCVLKALRSAPGFPALAASARTCVAARERAEKLAPASEPQVSTGEEIAPLLARLPLRLSLQTPSPRR